MSYIEISKSNLIHNINTVSAIFGIDKFAAVLKDNAYGHGLEICAKVCADAGVRYAVVRDNDEAEAVCRLFESVLVLADATTPKHQNIHIAINRLSDIKKLSPNTTVELKLDTGMHRNGVSLDELPLALEQLVACRLHLAGVFSHLKSADELSSECFWQEKNFDTARAVVAAFCDKNDLEMPKFHLHNSAGALRKKSFENFDMVRVGIAMYGYLDMPKTFEPLELKPVMKLYAQKISDKNAKSGFRLGYGGVYEVKDDMELGVYDVGYADGFMRLNEKKPYSCPNGAKIMSKVSMDNVIIASSEESVCLFDDARELARLCDTIVYDILVKLSPKIKRVAV